MQRCNKIICNANLFVVCKLVFEFTIFWEAWKTLLCINAIRIRFGEIYQRRLSQQNQHFSLNQFNKPTPIACWLFPIDIKESCLNCLKYIQTWDQIHELMFLNIIVHFLVHIYHICKKYLNISLYSVFGIICTACLLELCCALHHSRPLSVLLPLQLPLAFSSFWNESFHFSSMAFKHIFSIITCSN